MSRGKRKGPAESGVALGMCHPFSVTSVFTPAGAVIASGLGQTNLCDLGEPGWSRT